jgi:hypothetical protein
MPGTVQYYADAEDGTYLEDPTHADVVQLIQDLDHTTNTFVALYPGDDSREWFISVATRDHALGGYEIERHDPDTGHRATTTATIPTEIADNVLNWITHH